VSAIVLIGSRSHAQVKFPWPQSCRKGRPNGPIRNRVKLPSAHDSRQGKDRFGACEVFTCALAGTRAERHKRAAPVEWRLEIPTIWIEPFGILEMPIEAM
jgi:hypothetical protein